MPRVSKEIRDEMKYLRQQFPLMQTLQDMSPIHVKAILPYLDPNSHKALCCCVHNSIKNYPKFSSEQIDKLQETMGSQIGDYRYLSDKRFATSPGVVKRRAKTLVQSGEGLPAILAAVLPLLGSVLFPSK